MPKIQIALNAEQDKKIEYFKGLFELKTKAEAISKLIDLTKITSLDRSKEKDDVLEVFE